MLGFRHGSARRSDRALHLSLVPRDGLPKADGGVVNRSRATQDRLASRLAGIVGEREPRSGFPRPTLLPIPEGCAIVKGGEVTIDVSVSPETAAAMLRTLAKSRPGREPDSDAKPDALADAKANPG